MKRLHTIFVLVLALSLSLGVFWACKRTVKNDEVLGSTDMKSAPSDFTGITNSSGVVASLDAFRILDIGFPKPLPATPLSFGGKRYVYLNNTLSHDVTWFITFKGELSGAEKSFSGTGSKITKEEFIWDGEAEGYKFFLKDEDVNYSLTFLGSSIEYNGTWHIATAAGPKSYTNGNSKVNVLGDTIITYMEIDNFDGGARMQTSYSDAADGAGKAVFYVTDKNSVDGYLSYYMKATDNNGNNYCGGASGEALTELQGVIKEKDPSKVFINAYVYGYGKPNSTIFFQLFENDFAEINNPPLVPNVFPTRDKTKNDMWYTIVEVNWVGWKLISVPYSSFKPANNPLSGGGGNRIREPHKLVGFGIELESYPTPGQTVELGLDQINITTLGPFQP